MVALGGGELRDSVGGGASGRFQWAVALKPECQTLKTLAGALSSLRLA